MPYQKLLNPQLKTALQKLERENCARPRKLRQEFKEGSPLSNLFDRLQLKPCYAPPISVENPLTRNQASSSSTNLLVTITKITTTPVAPDEDKLTTPVVNSPTENSSYLMEATTSSPVDKFLTSLNNTTTPEYSVLNDQDNSNWNYHTQNLYQTFGDIYNEAKGIYHEVVIGIDN